MPRSRTFLRGLQVRKTLLCDVVMLLIFGSKRLKLYALLYFAFCNEEDFSISIVIQSHTTMYTGTVQQQMMHKSPEICTRTEGRYEKAKKGFFELKIGGMELTFRGRGRGRSTGTKAHCRLAIGEGTNPRSPKTRA